MPLYGFTGVYFAKYHNNNGAVTYDPPFTPGCPILANINFQFSEGDLWCGDAMSVYRRKIVAGDITFEAKVLSPDAQVDMFGASKKVRSVTYEQDGQTVTEDVESVVYADGDKAPYLGFAGFGPDAVDDNTDKYCAFFVTKSRFSPPNMSLQTSNNSITFTTPTTTGKFMRDDTTGKVVQEVAICDSEAAARAWCQAVFPQAQQEPGG